jgi:hypothetical protein
MAAKKKKNEIAKQDAHLPTKDYGEYAGDGWEDIDSSHMTPPWVYLLQPGSPQVNGTDDVKVEGAQAGMFWNSATNEVFDEIVLLPIAIEHKWLERLKSDNGKGAVVGRYSLTDPVVVEANKAAGGDPTKMYTPDGNKLSEVFTMFGVQLDENMEASPMIFSFEVMKIKEYKKGMAKIRSCKAAKGSALYSHRIKLTSWTDVGKKSGKAFQNVRLEPAINGNVMESMLPEDHPLLAECKQLREEMVSGNVKVDYEAQDSAEAPDGGEVEHF